jgi:UDP-glucose 4-epimerase
VFQTCAKAGVRDIVFSSTAAVYGEPDQMIIDESVQTSPVNPYGHSKLASEFMLKDIARVSGMRSTILRYFNVAGADTKLRTGQRTPEATHLIKVAAEVAAGQRSHLNIFGTDYPTRDGTCIRDYVHVSDLVRAHLSVQEVLRPGDVRRYNIGIGRGFSVRECVESVRRVTGVPITSSDGPRRDGDPPVLTADASLIQRELGWQPVWTDLDAIVDSAWQWFKANPRGWSG